MPCRPHILAAMWLCYRRLPALLVLERESCRSKGAFQIGDCRGAHAVQLENLARRIGRKGVQVGNSLSFKCPADRISSMRRLHGIQIVYVPTILYDGVGWKIL